MVFKEVKKTMIDQDITTIQLASIIGYSRAYVNNLINGHVHSEKAKKAIALAFGKNYKSLWSEDNTPEL